MVGCLLHVRIRLVARSHLVVKKLLHNEALKKPKQVAVNGMETRKKRGTGAPHHSPASKMDDFDSLYILRCITVCCKQILFSPPLRVPNSGRNFDYLLLDIGVTLGTQLLFERIEIILIDTKPSIDHDFQTKPFHPFGRFYEVAGDTSRSF